MKHDDLQSINLERAKLPIVIERGRQMVFLCNKRGVNIARAGACFETMESVVTLPRVKWLEDNHGQGKGR